MTNDEFSISKYLMWDEIVDALVSELDATREKKTEYTLYSGSRSKKHTQNWIIYTFQKPSEDRIDPNYVTEVCFNDRSIQNAQVLGIKGNKVRVAFPIKEKLPDKIPILTLISDPSFIVQQLLTLINDLKHHEFGRGCLLDSVMGSLEGLQSVIENNPDTSPATSTLRYNQRQSEAIKKATSNRVLFIWGPPGTGKTTILGKIISDLVKQDETVFLCSNTNRAVDVSMLKALEVSNYEETPIRERSLRWGDVFLTEEDELQHVTLYSHHQRLYDQKCESVKHEFELISAYDEFSPTLNKLNGELRPHKMKLRKLKELEGIEAKGNLNQTQAQRLKDLRDKLEGSSVKIDTIEQEVARIEKKRAEVEKQIVKEYKSTQRLRDFLNEKTTVEIEEIIAQVRFHGATFARSLVNDELHKLKFDNVIVDEASMASLPYIIYLLSKARKRVIFVGDPQQLEPIVLSDSPNAKKWLGTDVFMHTASATTIDTLFSWQQQNPDVSVLLQEQYRMPQKIYQIVNNLFYRGSLVNNVENTGKITVYDTSKLNPPLTFPSKNNHSPVNMIHAELVLAELQKIVAGSDNIKDKAREIGVMVPYTQQKRFLQYLSKTRYIPDTLEIGVVHTFQGREKPIVLMDLTLSGIDFTYPNFDEHKTSRMSVSRLLNVGVSRCQANLDTATGGEFVLVANFDYFERYYRAGIVWEFLQAVKNASDEYTVLDTEPDPLTAGFQETPQADLFSEYDDVETQVDIPAEAVQTPTANDKRIAKTIEKDAGRIVQAIGQINTVAKKIGTEELFHKTDNIREILTALPFKVVESEAEFGALVIDLNKLIYEASGGKDAEYPVRQQRAHVGRESYGKIRWVLNQLRQFYAHDIATFSRKDQERIKSFVDEFFDSVVSDRSCVTTEDWTRLQIALMHRVVDYLQTLYTKLNDRSVSQQAN